MRASEADAKKISHSCYINEGDEKVLTFAMQTPSPVKSRPLTVGDLSNSVNSSGPPTGEFEGDSYDKEFLKEIDGMALDASISEEVIPTIFYTPRVSGRSVSSRPGGATHAENGSPGAPSGSPLESLRTQLCE